MPLEVLLFSIIVTSLKFGFFHLCPSFCHARLISFCWLHLFVFPFACLCFT